MTSRDATRAFSATRRSAVIAVSLLALMGASRVAAAAPEKKIGFSVKVMTAGLTKTTVDSIVITAVAPNSQAADAGVVVGDNVYRIEKTVVPGNSVFKLKEYMGFVPGVPKLITFRRANGAVYDVTFVRAPKAAGGR